jgi:4-diphosphocytidyl-2-C-methyl-D-erythritol kinase
MSKLTLQSNAKVNLSLDILGREPKGPFKGYHFVQTVLHEITPQNTHDFKSDIIHIEIEPHAEPSEPKIEIKCDHPDVPTDETNTAYKAARILLEKSRPAVTSKITITIEKNIPIASGLGGASSNAAETIKGLNQLLKLNLTPNKMQSIAAEVGMDAPFFIRGGVALAEHYGEQITTLPPIHGTAFTIFMQGPSLTPVAEPPTPQTNKTQSQYSKIALSLCGKNIPKTEALIHAIKTNDNLALHKNLHNDFETLLKEPLAKNHHLTGSGPVYFILA